MEYPKELTAADKESLKEQTSSPPDWDGVFWISPRKIEECNCFGWALGDADVISIPDKADTCLYLINKDSDLEYEFNADGDFTDSKFILWGPDKNDVQHITVRLSDKELAARKKVFDFLEEVDMEKLADDVSNPFWSSAIGFGVGVITNPEMWFKGGVHKRAVVGIKLKE